MNKREFKFTLPTGQTFTATPGQPFTVPAEIAASLNDQIKNKLSTPEATIPDTSSALLTPDIKSDPQLIDEPVVEPQEPEPTAATEQVDAITQELIDFIKECNEEDQKLNQLIQECDALSQKIEQQQKQLEGENKINEDAIKLKITENMKNKQEKNTEKIPTDILKKEIEKNIQTLFNNMKDKDPEIKKFQFTSSKKGFMLESTIKINNTGYKLFQTVTVELKVPLINNSKKELTVGEPTIDAGFMATGTVKSIIKPQLPQLIPLMKEYFEKEYKKQIESMSYEDDNLVLTFKE